MSEKSEKKKKEKYASQEPSPTCASQEPSLTCASLACGQKLQGLRGLLGKWGQVAVAFSGGVDSTFLLGVCRDVLGPGRVMAVTADSPLLPRQELAECRETVRELGLKDHLVLPCPDLGGAAFVHNPRDRCYYCKKEIYLCFLGVLEGRLGRGEGGWQLLDGTNRDDLSDFRPGLKALRELGVRSPLEEAGLVKEEIRYLARQGGLQAWDKPSQACLATRIPCGQKVSPEKLLQVEKGERFLKSLGFTRCRLRHHGALACLEVPPENIGLLLEMRRALQGTFQGLGFQRVSVDLEGLRET